MGNVWSSLILLLLLCASAGAGFFVNSRLPEEHRSRDSIELIQLANALLVTFTAIVLGLLDDFGQSGVRRRLQRAGRLRRPACSDGPMPARLWTRDGAYPRAVARLRRRGHRQHLAFRAASRQCRLSQYVKYAADRRKLGVSRADERYRSRSALDAADRHAAQEPDKPPAWSSTAT